MAWKRHDCGLKSWLEIVLGEWTMSPEERQLLTQLFDRLAQASSNPRDSEAESLIAAELQRQPHAAYYMAQAVIIQEKGLEAATAKIRDLEAHVQELESRIGQSSTPAQQGSFLGGLSSIFGGGNAAPAPQGGPWGRSPQAPAQAGRLYDNYSQNAGYPQTSAPQASGFQQQAAPSAGGGFLRGALTTAAGVAGGVLMADAVRDIFTTHGGGFGNMLGMGSGMAGMGAAPVEETIINNNTYNITEPNSDAGNSSNDNSDNGYQQADYDDNDDGGYDDSGDFGGDDSMNA
jgi:uncharacterized protein